ncbi:MAG: hypothetical protein SNJ82_05840, partial [Gemmataceae bacterium]
GLPAWFLTEETTLRPGALSLSADGRKIAVGLSEGRVHLWDTNTQRKQAFFDLSPGQILQVALSPRGETLAVALADGSLQLLPTTPNGRSRVSAQTRHELPEAELDPAWKTERYRVAALAFAPDGARLLSIGTDRTARLHHARNGRLLFQIDLPTVPTAAAFFPSGRLFAVGSADGVIRIYDTLTGKPRAHFRDRREFFPQGQIIRHLTFSASGETLLAVTPRGIEQWDIARTVRPSQQERQPLPFNLLDGYLPGQVLKMVGSREHIVTLLKKEGIYTFKTPKLEIVGEPFRLPPQQSADLLLSGDGQRCLVSSGFQMQILDLPSHRQLASIPEAILPSAIALSASGHLVASVHKGRLRLWEPDSGQPARWKLLPEGEKVCALAVHPSEQRIALARSDSRLIDWLDPHTGMTLARLIGHSGPPSQLAISPDGRAMASFGADRLLLLWDTASLRWRVRWGIPTVAAPTEASLQFSADSRTLVLAQHDVTVVVDVASGRCLNTLPTPHCLGFALDGACRLYVAMNDRPLRLVNLQKPPYSQRPTTVAPVHSDSVAPEATDLVPQTTEPHLTLVGDRDKKTVLAFTRDRLVFRLDLSTLQKRDVFWTGQIIYNAALHSPRGLLLAASVDLKHLERLDTPQKARGPLLIYDVRELLAGQAAKPVLLPRGSLPLSGHFDSLLVGAEVAIIRERKDKQATLHVVDLVKLRIREPLDVPLDPSGPLALSSDGQTLIVSGTQAGKSGGALVRVHLATRRVSPVVELPKPIRELVLTPHWLLVRTQFDPIHGSTVFLDEQDRELARWKEDNPAGELLAVGTRLFSLVERGRFSPRELAVGKEPPATRPAVPSRPLESFFLDPPYVGPVRVVAGQWLVIPSGHAYRLREAGVVKTPELSEAPAPPAGLKLLEARHVANHERIHLLHAIDRNRVQMCLSSGRIVDESPWTLRHEMLGRPEEFVLGYTTQERRPIVVRDRLILGGPGVNACTMRLLGGDRIVVDAHGRLVYPSPKGLALKPLREGAVAQLFPVDEPISTLDAHPRGGLACGDVAGKVHFLAPGEDRLHSLQGHEGEVRVVLLADAGRVAFSAGLDGRIHRWDTTEGKRVQSLEGHPHVVSALALSPDEKWLASGALDGSVVVWDLSTGRKHFTWPGRPSEPIGGLLFCGEELVVAAGPRLVRYAWPA